MHLITNKNKIMLLLFISFLTANFGICQQVSVNVYKL